jgi:hypothetical protein
MLSSLQGSNNIKRIRNNSAQGNERINTVEMVWERCKNGGGGERHHAVTSQARTQGRATKEDPDKLVKKVREEILKKRTG